MMTEKGEDCSRKGFTRIEGFTLIELAIVVVISGFIMASLSTGMALYRKQAVLDKTNNNIDAVSLGIDHLFTPMGTRYPRPAGRNLDPTDPDYGIEISEADATALAVGDCTASMVCKVAGARDADGDSNPDPILIGAIPVRSLRNSLLDFAKSGSVMGLKVTESASYDANLDGWGRMFTYAVTEKLSMPGTYDELHGAIALETENGENLLAVPGSAHAVFISHGPDGKGAFTPEGKLYKACGNPADGKDVENCDDDETFTIGLISLGHNNEYFDDILRFRIRGSSALWKSVNGGSGIVNTNPGRVGIGTTAPTQRLHVVGDMQGEIARADGYCDSTGADCMLPATIGGAGISCGSGSAMSGISFNNADCDASPGTTASLTSCTGPGQLLQGVNADGSLICGP